MKRTLFRKYRRLRLETLEPRQMLAGDVTVNVTGGNLSIVGDSEMNSITITATTTAGEFVVEGSSTTVNGGLSATVSGVVGNVNIQLGDNYDSLTFDTDPAAIHFAGDMHIDMGLGYPGYLAMHHLTVTGSNAFSVDGSLDVITGFSTVAEIENAFIGGDFHLIVSNEIHGVELRGGSIAGDLTIEGNAGSVIVGASVGGDLHFTSAASVASLRVEGDSTDRPHIGGSVYITTGIGHFYLTSCDVDEDVVVNGGVIVNLFDADIDGDLVATLNMSGVHARLADAPAQTPFSQVGGNFIVTYTGTLNGNTELNFLNVTHDLVVRGNANIQNVRLNNVRAGNSLLIDTGDGNDIVWVHNSSADGEAAILGGAGSDYVRVGNFLAHAASM